MKVVSQKKLLTLYYFFNFKTLAVLKFEFMTILNVPLTI